MSESRPAKTRSGPARTAYLVLGMHRSGTSAITQVLALAGAELPRNVMGGDEHNAKGYFEPWKIALFNDERLRAAGAAWDDVFAFPFRELASRAERDWTTRAEALFAEEYGDATFPLLKDPRVTVLLPLWRTILDGLDVSARCVIPVRHPLAVAGSLARRNGFSPEKSVLLWSAYMLAAEAYSRDLPRAFVSYDGLLEDWRAEVTRIEAGHGAPLPRLTDEAAARISSFLSPELRHNAADDGLAALGWAGEIAAQVHAWFERASTDQGSDPKGLDAPAARLTERGRDIAALVSPVTRDLDIARSELTDLRQRLAYQQAQGLRLEAELDALRRACVEAGDRLDAVLADD